MKAGNTVAPESGKRAMATCCMVSLLIHAILVVFIVVAAACKAGRSFETITVVLSNDAFTAKSGGTGGDGKAPGSRAGDKKRGRGLAKAESRKARTLSGGMPPPVRTAAPVKDDKSDNVAAANDEPDVVTFGKAQPVRSKSEPGGPGTGDGGGYGGGGSGIGSYGPGSGFGGVGKGGTGSGHGRGFGKSVRDDGKARYLREHFHYIREMILKHLAYPALAKKMRWQGEVTVSFVISEKGCVESMKVVKSSGYKILDAKVMDTIREIQPFPKPPVRAEIVIPVSYKLG